MRRCFVSITTKNYHYLSVLLSNSISEFSSYPIHIFCINYNPKKEGLEMPSGAIFHEIEYDINENGTPFNYVEGGNFYVDRRNLRSFQIMTRKSEACLRVLDMGYDECCFIDGDSIACPNIDEIFSYSDKIKSTPLMTKGPHEFVMVTDDDGNVRGNPFEGCWPERDLTKTIEYPLMKFFQVPIESRDEYRTGNLFLFNQGCKEFLIVLEEVLNVLWKVVDVYEYSPFQDESVMNTLVWKNGGGGLPMSYINIEGMDTVLHFFQNPEEVESGLISSFYRIPENKRDIKVLHGEKRKQEVETIIEYLKELKNKGYYDNGTEEETPEN